MKILVWDWPTRAFHWLLALCAVLSVITAKVGGDAMVWHGRLGYCALGLLIFRILWGFAGSRYARFASFPPSPWRTLAYLKGKAAMTLGHNPLGAGSVYLLLLSFTVQAVSGLFANDDVAFEGPLAKKVSGSVVDTMTEIHEFNEKVIYALVALHVLAIAFYWFKKRENLVGPMLHGTKDGSAAEAASWSRAKGITALVLAGLSAGLVWLLVTL
jgi:cytochrome b